MDGAWCVSARAAELKALLDRYKFDSAIEAGALCADFLDKCVPILPEATTVVPVPTSPARIRARGFDHTAVIAWQFAKIRNFPYHAALLRTGGQTQHFKSRTERFRTAAETVAAKSVVPEVVLLIDDIYTTGATIQACADKLRQQGAKQLYVAIIARQTLDDNSDL